MFACCTVTAAALILRCSSLSKLSCTCSLSVCLQGPRSFWLLLRCHSHCTSVMALQPIPAALHGRNAACMQS